MTKENIQQLEHGIQEDHEPVDLKDIDTTHNDEALKVLHAEHGADTWEPEEEKALVKKIDRKLMVILCIVFPLQAYDKNMLGQAAIFGLRTDLHLTQQNFAMCAAFLYIGYFCGAYPASMLAQRFRIERTAGSLIFLWALCLMLTVLCKNFGGLVTQRIFLGFLEGGVSPIFTLVTASWYTKSESALRMGLWWCSSGYTGFYGPLINYAIGLINGGSLRSWQYMFLVAGALTTILGIVCFVFLPGDPIKAKGFTARERYIAVARLRSNNSGVRNLHWKKEQVIEALTDVRFWLMFFIGVLSMIGNGAYSTMTPIVLNNFGFDSFHSLLLSSPSGVVAGTAQLIGPVIASRTKNMRCILMMAFQVPVLVAAMMLWLLPRDHAGPLLFALYAIPCFTGTYTLAFGLTVANCAGYTKRSVYASGIFLGYCVGNIAGPLSFTDKDAPDYVAAFIWLAVSTVLCTSLIFIYRFICIRDNRKRDEAGYSEGFDHAFEDDITDKKNLQFRYIY